MAWRPAAKTNTLKPSIIVEGGISVDGTVFGGRNKGRNKRPTPREKGGGRKKEPGGGRNNRPTPTGSTGQTLTHGITGAGHHMAWRGMAWHDMP